MHEWDEPSVLKNEDSKLTVGYGEIRLVGSQ